MLAWDFLKARRQKDEDQSSSDHGPSKVMFSGLVPLVWTALHQLVVDNTFSFRVLVDFTCEVDRI